MSRFRDGELIVWRALALAGASGLTGSQLRINFKGKLTSAEVSYVLQLLRNQGYVQMDGLNRRSQWRITGDCGIPRGEQRPGWLDHQPAVAPVVAAPVPAPASSPDADADSDDAIHERHPAPGTCAPVHIPAAPASVFAPASWLDTSMALPVRASRSMRAPTREQLETTRSKVMSQREFERAAQPAPPLNWKAPEATPALEPAAQTPAAFPAGREFVCSVNSNGELYVFSDQTELLLDLDHTRKLLHYLDRMRASELFEAIR